MSDKLHNALKHKLIDDGRSIQEYVISLITQDMHYVEDDATTDNAQKDNAQGK